MGPEANPPANETKTGGKHQKQNWENIRKTIELLNMMLSDGNHSNCRRINLGEINNVRPGPIGAPSIGGEKREKNMLQIKTIENSKERTRCFSGRSFEWPAK